MMFGFVKNLLFGHAKSLKSAVELREEQLESVLALIKAKKAKNHIVVDGKPFPIDWEKVDTTSYRFDLPEKSYGGFSKKKPGHKKTMAVIHWDVCLSSMTCFDILVKKKISTHFSIDNDGTIYQFLDTNHCAWHAGVGVINEKAIGIDLSNAYYVKYNEVYEARGFGSRPILTNTKVHGQTLKEHLGFYPVQIEALKALFKALNQAHDIPLEAPLDSKGNFLTKYDKNIANGKFSGIISHFHCRKDKIDVAGLDLKEIIEEVKNG